MDPETQLPTDLLTRGVLSVEQFATEMARRSGFQPSNPRLADGFRAQGLPVAAARADGRVNFLKGRPRGQGLLSYFGLSSVW